MWKWLVGGAAVLGAGVTGLMVGFAAGQVSALERVSDILDKHAPDIEGAVREVRRVAREERAAYGMADA